MTPDLTTTDLALLRAMSDGSGRVSFRSVIDYWGMGEKYAMRWLEDCADRGLVHRRGATGWVVCTDAENAAHRAGGAS